MHVFFSSADLLGTSQQVDGVEEVLPRPQLKENQGVQGGVRGEEVLPHHIHIHCLKESLSW